MIGSLSLAFLALPAGDPSCTSAGLRWPVAGFEILAEGEDVDLGPARLAPASAPRVATEWLELGEVWRVRSASGGETPLELPRAVRRPAAATLLHATDDTAWVALPGGVVIVHRSPARATLAALPPTHLTAELLAMADGGVRLRVGLVLWQCSGAGCWREAEIPAAAGTVIARGAMFWTGKSGGVYRMPPRAALPVVATVPGKVLRLCGSAGGVWAVVRDQEDLALVRLDATSPAQSRWSPWQALATALSRAAIDDAALDRGLEALSSEPGRVPVALAVRAAAHPMSRWRRASVAWLVAEPSTVSVAALWRLAHDKDAEIRQLILGLRGCCTALPGLGRGLLMALFDDGDEEVAWAARDALLFDEPAAALADAPLAYRLDVLSLLTAELQRRDSRSTTQVLDELRRDPSPEVRAGAESLTELSIR